MSASRERRKIGEEYQRRSDHRAPPSLRCGLPEQGGRFARVQDSPSRFARVLIISRNLPAHTPGALVHDQMRPETISTRDVNR